MIIRQAKEEDVLQIAEILVEDWKTAYRGIMDDDFLDSLSAEQRYRIEINRYRKFTVAAENDDVLGYAWNEMTEDEEFGPQSQPRVSFPPSPSIHPGSRASSRRRSNP